MKRTAALAAVLSLYPAIAWAQYAPQYPSARTSASSAPARPAAVPASAAPATAAATPASDLSPLLIRINQASVATQEDLAALRIEKWKADAASKDQFQQQATSLQRNLAAALPELMAQVRAHPDDLAASFKLYRNLNALYDVLAPLADAAARVGPQSEFDALAREASSFDQARRAFADRLDSLAAARDDEVTKLRAQVKAASTPPPPSKKIIVDDTKSKSTKKTKGTKKKPASSGSPPSSSSQE